MLCFIYCAYDNLGNFISRTASYRYSNSSRAHVQNREATWFYRGFIVLWWFYLRACPLKLQPNPILISEISRRKRSLDPVFCKHCNSYVSHTNFYRHKAKFYDSTRDIRTVSVALELSDSDSDVDILSDPEISGRGSPI